MKGSKLTGASWLRRYGHGRMRRDAKVTGYLNIVVGPSLRIWHPGEQMSGACPGTQEVSLGLSIIGHHVQVQNVANRDINLL